MKYYFLNYGRTLLFSVFLCIALIGSAFDAVAQCPDASGVVVEYTVISCNGVDDGSVTLTITNPNGYAGEYSYSLFRNPETGIPPGLFTETTSDLTWTFTGLIPATYSIIITPEAPCVNIFPGDVVLTEPDPLVATLDGITPACTAGTGGIDISVSGGNGNYTYSWTGPTDPGNIEDPSSIDAGTYSVTVTDDKNCSVTIPDIFVPIITEADAGADQTVCTSTANLSGNAYRNPGESGTWTLISGSGSIIDPTDPTSAVVNLGEGDNVFEWFITDDAAFCPGSTDQVTISWNNLQLISPGDILLNCNGVADGSGAFTLTGGTAPFTFTIDNNSSGATTSASGATLNFTDAGVGNLSVTATDASTCSVSAIISITEPPAIVVDSEAKTDATCDGGNDGSVTVTASGGSGSLTFTLMPDGVANSSGFFDGLDAGNYTVNVTDDNSCGPVASSTLSILAPAPIVIDNSSSTNISCNSGNDGSITIEASGGTGQLSYTLQPSAINNTTGVFTGLSAGDYTVEITDANGCGPLVTPVITITEPAGVSIDTISSTDITCNGNDDGSITIAASSGATPYTFTLLPGGANNTTGVFNGLAPGTYQVDVTESNGCGPVNTGDIIISEPPVLAVATPTGTDITCNGLTDGTIDVTASGGSGTLSYTLQPGGIVSATGNFTGVAAGTYTIDVQDANSCLTSSTPITLNEPPSIIIDNTSTTDVTCNGGNDGSLEVTATGGTGTLNFTLQPGGISNTTGLFGSLIAGSYTVDVTDVNGCGPVMSAVVNITEPSLDLAVSDAVMCNPATGDVVITISGTTAGIEYELETLGGASLTPAVSAISSGGDLDLAIAQADVPLVTTTYQIEVLNPGCSGQILTDQPVVTIVTSPSATLAVSDASSCENSTTDVSFIITGAENGITYELQLTDGSSLTPAVTASGTGGDVALIIASGDLPATSTTYQVAASAGAGCATVLTDQPTLSLLPADDLNVTIAADQLPVCQGDAVTFTATPENGGATPGFQWQVNGTDIPGETSDTFVSTLLNNGDLVRVVVTADPAATCINGSPATSNEITFTSTTSLTAGVSITADQNPTCAGNTITFTSIPVNAGANPTYQWQVNGTDVPGVTGPGFIASALSDGDQVHVILTPDPSLGCVSNAMATSNDIVATFVTDLTASVTISADQDPVCDGLPVNYTAVVSNAGANPTFQWQINGTDILGAVNSTYSSSTLDDGDLVRLIVTADPSFSCIINSPVTSNELTVNETTSGTISASLGIDQNPICSGDLAQLTVSATNAGVSPTYQWQVNGIDIPGETGATFSSTSFNDGDQVRVIVTADPSAGCVTNSPFTSSSISLNVTPSLDPSATVVADQNPVCSGDAIIFTATVTDAGAAPSFQWRINGTDIPGETGQTYTAASPADGDNVDVIVTLDPSATCTTASSVTSNMISISVVSDLTASAVITVDQNPVCLGSESNFTITTMGAGANPTFQWQVNGSDIPGETNDTFSFTLDDGDMVTALVTADPAATCVSNSPVLSNAIQIQTVTDLIADVTISADQNNVCNTTPITFTASINQAGANPIIQWRVNGTDVPGETNTIFTSSSLSDGDQVTAFVTADSLASCVSNSPVASNAIDVNLVSNLTAIVAIAADQNPVCTGSTVNFTASIAQAGANPTLQWQVNGTDVPGETATIFSSASLNNGDLVTAILTADPSASCVTNSPVTSNTIQMSISSDINASVNIVPDQNPVCSGDVITFSAIDSGAGGAPSYQWQRNGSDVPGETGATYAAVFTNGDQVTVDVTADPAATCVSNSPITSNSVTVTTTSDLTASASITADQNPVCSDDAITFTATISQAGAAPTLQWRVNGSDISGETGLIFSSTSLSDGDQVSAIVTADPAATCVSNSPVTTNAVTVNIAGVLNASVTITADQNPVCTGDFITFTANAMNDGANPSYQWRVNGTDMSGETAATFAASSLNTGDLVSVVLTADPAATCVSNSPVVSGTISVNVVNSLTPAVSISADQNPVCVGDAITWSANVNNAGANPGYQWQVNGTDVTGETTDLFTSTSFSDGDQVTVVVTADPAASCVTSTIVTSAPETVNVVTSLTPTVMIAASQTTICSGQSVSFTATTSNGGPNPSYQWQINGSPVVGATNAALTISSIANGDQVNVLVTADPAVSCATGGAVSSNVINMTVRPIGDPACVGGGENCGAFVVEVTPLRPPCNAPDAGSLSFTISGGTGNYTVILSDNASFNQGEAGLAGTPIIFEDLTAADYQYTIKDSNGTTCTLPFTLDNETILEAAVMNVTPSACYNEPEGSVTIEILSGGNAPYEYSMDGVLWNQATTSVFTVNGLSPADSPIGILIRDDFSDVCPEEVLVTIDNLYPEITAAVSTIPVTTCDGTEGEVTVEYPPAGGNVPNDQWTISLVPGTGAAGTMTSFTESRTFTGLAAGEYSLYLEDEGGCQKKIPVTVGAPNQVNLEALVETADCSNDGQSGGLLLQVTNTLQVPGPYNIVITAVNGAQAGDMIYANATWTGQLLTFDTLVSATYSIQVTPSQADLCAVEVERTISGGPQPIAFDYTLACGASTSNKELLLTDIEGNEGDPYTLQVFDNLTSALEEEITFTLNIGNQYLLQNYLFLTRIKEYKLRLIQRPAICGGAEIRYDHPANLLIPASLNAQVGESVKSFPDRSTGELEVVNFTGGYQPTDNAYPYMVAIQLDSAAVPGQSYTSEFDTVRLNNNLDFVIRFKKIPAGRYRIIVMDQLGCTRVLTGRVPLDTDLFIPNIFTPNGDQQNETFFIRNKPDANVRILITNRWGKRVYESSDYKNNWEGTDVADGIYYYLVDTGDQVYKGWVEILRGSRP